MKPAQIQPKSQFLFQKDLPPRDFSVMTLASSLKTDISHLRRQKALRISARSLLSVDWQ